MVPLESWRDRREDAAHFLHARSANAGFGTHKHEVIFT